MKHESKLKVRFAETDLLGHVNNSSYFIYLEQGRIDFFQDLEMDSQENDWNFILASIKCDFLRQAFFNQKLTITTQVGRIGNKSFQLVQTVCDSDTGGKIAHSDSAIIYFDFEKQASEPLPQHLRENLRYYLVDKTDS